MNKTRVLGPLAVLLAMLAPLSACGPGGGDTSAPRPSPNADNKAAAGPMKLEYVLRGTPLPQGDADFVKKEIDKKLNIDLQLTLFPSSEDQINAVNVRMASGDDPDFFIVPTRQQLLAYVEKGLVLDLTPYFDKLKPTIDFVGKNNLKKAEFNGKTYAVVKSPETPSGQLDTYWIRKDWLDKLGLSIPRTTDELYEVAKAFTEKDPDGNGKKDTYGITGIGLNAFGPIFGAFGVPGISTLYPNPADGKLLHGAFDPNSRQALAYIQKLIDGGLVDSEIMTNKGLMHQEKAIQGKAGIAMIGWAYTKKEDALPKYTAVNPNADWVEIPPVTGPGGKSGVPIDMGRSNGYIVIPKSMEKNKAKLDKIIELLNYLSGEEGNRLVSYGIEGRHYHLQGDKIVATEWMGKEAAYSWMYQITGVNEMEYLHTKFSSLTRHIEFVANQAKAKHYNSFVIAPSGYNVSDADRFIEEEIVKFMYGKAPLDQYDDFLKTLDATFKHNLYRAEAEKQLKELGIVK